MARSRVRVPAPPQVYQAVQWPQAGVNLASPAITTPTSGVVMGDATDTASGTACTIVQRVRSCSSYDNTLTSPVADQGVCFNYFGGTQSVSNGMCTIVWSANGVWRVTC